MSRSIMVRMVRMVRVACVMGTLGASVVATSARADELPAPPVTPVAPPGGPAAGQNRSKLPELYWDWPTFGTADYIITGTAAAITLAAAIAPPMTKHAVGPVLFDDAARKSLRIGTSSGRYIARDASDVGLSLAATWPVFVDSLITAWWYRGSREVAQETALIDLETLAIAGAVQGATNVFVSRERPYGADCGTAIPGNTLDCDGTTRYRSFFSGHAAFSFTSAALVCTHHFQLDLLGAPYDALSCIFAYGVAATTATMRVAGDVHYASDAVTGALIGTLVGYGVPFLHYRNKALGAVRVGDVRFQIAPSVGGAGISGTF